MRRIGCSIAVACVALAPAPTLAAAVAKDSRAASVTPELRQWLGKRTVDVIATADRGEIVRVAPEPIQGAARRKASPPNVGGYPIVGKAHLLDADLLEQFRSALLDPATHAIEYGVIKLCGPIEPGVALRLWSRADTKRRAPIEILFCFACDDLMVVGPDAYPQSITPGALRLLRLSAAGLPEFTELRGILSRK